MTKLVTANYSRNTGARTTDGFALRNPNYVKSVTLDPKFLRGKTFKIAKDGMPANLAEAEKALLAWNTHQAKLEARRAAAKAKKAAAAVKQVTKKTSRVVKRDLTSGEFAKKSSTKKNVVSDVIKAPVRHKTTKAPLVKKTVTKNIKTAGGTTRLDIELDPTDTKPAATVAAIVKAVKKAKRPPTALPASQTGLVKKK